MNRAYKINFVGVVQCAGLDELEDPPDISFLRF